MRPDNMPRPFAPKHSEKMTHVEVLRKVRSLIEFEVKHSPNANAAWTSWHNEKLEALTAAIAALEAVKHLEANHYNHHALHMICIPTDEWKAAMNLLPADAVGGE